MTIADKTIFIALLSLATMATRFLPFTIAQKITHSEVFRKVESILPTFVLGLIVIYCYRNTQSPEYIKQVLAGAFVITLQLAFRKYLLSLFLGSGLYLTLVN